VIVLDTHAWIWWLASPERLSRAARTAIVEAPTVGVSTLSVWELGTLVRRGRIELDRDVSDWVRGAFNFGGLAPIPPDAQVALAAAELSVTEFPGDPADRFIYATAGSLSAPLVTRDTAIRKFDPDGTVW
jgi:PIN domain nuclease of toxin-antitoxin system